MEQGEILASPGCSPAEMAAKRKLVEVLTVAKSEFPLRVTKRRTGVVLGSFRTRDEVTTFIAGLSLESLQVKPTRRRARA